MPFFYLHSFVKLPAHIRYLAISSISRIDSETEMAAIVFRTCLEVTLKTLYPEYKAKNQYKKESTLEETTEDLYNRGILTKQIKEYCDIIRHNGNDAAHTGELQDYIATIIIAFVYVMEFCNKKF